MTEIKNPIKDEITFHRPREYTPSNICFWEATSRELKFNKEKGATALLSKARNFLESECIIEIEKKHHWACKPIKNYNKTTYSIKRENGHYSCNCQGYNKKLNEGVDEPICSHILAVIQFRFIEENNI